MGTQVPSEHVSPAEQHDPQPQRVLPAGQIDTQEPPRQVCPQPHAGSHAMGTQVLLSSQVSPDGQLPGHVMPYPQPASWPQTASKVHTAEHSQEYVKPPPGAAEGAQPVPCGQVPEH